MDEPGCRPDPRADDQDSAGDLIDFGGYPTRGPLNLVESDRWPLNRIRSRWQQWQRSASRTPATTVRVALIALAGGLLVGFIGGHLAARPAHNNPPRAARIPAARPLLLPAPIADTGAHCAVQLGRRLQLGIEIVNQSGNAVSIGRISPIFPLDGLRTISSGTGTCGALPVAGTNQWSPLLPGGSEWVTTTLSVRVPCPEPLPVWFKIEYTQGNRTGSTVLRSFPDLGQVSYRKCD